MPSTTSSATRPVNDRQLQRAPADQPQAFARVEIGEQASGPNGNVTAEEAEPTSADGSRSGSDEPQPVKQ